MAKKTIQLASIETRSHWILDKWTLEDPTVLDNPHYIASMGEDRAEVAGSCGDLASRQTVADPAYQPPEVGQDPMCSNKPAAITADRPSPGSFGWYLQG